jgi:hypothetical protein
MCLSASERSLSIAASLRVEYKTETFGTGALVAGEKHTSMWCNYYYNFLISLWAGVEPNPLLLLPFIELLTMIVE